MASIRASTMKLKSMNRILATCIVSILVGGAAQAAQIILPKHVSGANGVAAGTNIATTGVAGAAATTSVDLPAGQSLTFDVEYSVNGVQNGDESGLGLKVRYNSAFFQDATIANVTNLFTKCMIAAPSAQASSVGGFDREVVFGWLDTSIRRTSGTPNGSVGWPAQPDPTAVGDGCLDPGNIANDTGAQTNPKVLFRISLQSKPTAVAGQSSTISITSDGNVSYAKTSGVTEPTTGSLAETTRTIAVVGAAAPSCNLDVDGSGGNPTASIDGLLIKRALNSFIPATNILIGITLPGTATRTTGQDIRNYVVGLGNVLDVDGGGVGTPAASVDGLLIQRALNTFITATAVTSGISTSATGSAIRTYLTINCGIVFP